MKLISAKLLLVAGICLSLPALFGCGESEPEEDSLPTVSDHIGKARAFYHQANYLKAVEMYQKALALDPGNADAYLQIGIIYDDNLKDEKKAIYCYRKYLALDPGAEKAAMVREWLKASGSDLRGIKPSEVKEKGLPAGKAEKPRSPQKPPPEKGPSPAVRVESPGPSAYTVKEGDTLARIAEVFYGDRKAWQRIFKANRDLLPSPHALRPGQVLKIPPAGKKAIIEM